MGDILSPPPSPTRVRRPPRRRGHLNKGWREVAQGTADGGTAYLIRLEKRECPQRLPRPSGEKAREMMGDGGYSCWKRCGGDDDDDD